MYKWKTLHVSCLTGWFMGVKAVKSESLHSAVLASPEIRESSATCRLRLRYFLWDSGNTALANFFQILKWK